MKLTLMNTSKRENLLIIATSSLGAIGLSSTVHLSTLALRHKRINMNKKNRQATKKLPKRIVSQDISLKNAHKATKYKHLETQLNYRLAFGINIQTAII